MQVNSISNQNFGTLKYSPTARKIITKLIKEDIISNNRSIVQHLSWNFQSNHINGLKMFEEHIRSKRIKSEKHTENILNKFKEALEFAQQSKTLKLIINHRAKTAKYPAGIVATINEEQFVHRQNSSMLNFLNKISNKILNK